MISNLNNIITYSLRNDQNHSDKFYSDLEKFTDQFEKKFYFTTGPILTQYITFLKMNKIETLRHNREYLFDILAFGVLWRRYITTAMQVNVITTMLMKKLYQLRRKYKKVKPVIDSVRGILATLFLVNQENNRHFSQIPLHIKSVKKLNNYLDATGEFREEVKRFNLFKSFLFSLESDNVESTLENILVLAGWFNDNAEKAFHIYIPHVKTYLTKQANQHKWQEDYIFCRRNETEYFLNMVGSELMNKAFKIQFQVTQHKAVLLPACMRKHSNDGKCKARKISLDYICSGCTKDCKINQYTQLGQENGFNVHIIPHSSDFTKWLETFAVGKEIGVVGVACLLNLITGGLELKSLDIPAQCVFLDFCGCSHHWSKDGITTDINSNRLLEIIHSETKTIVSQVACA